MADFLLLPMVALIAFWLVSRAGISGEGAALLTAGATVGADRIVKLYTDRFIRQVDALIIDEATRRKQAIREEIQTELSAERTMRDIAAGKRPLGGE
jgi:phosphopantetheine adenylyltransferase